MTQILIFDFFNKGMDDVAMIHNGFLVRIRPGAIDFLEQVSKGFNVVFFTSAVKSVYQGMM